VSGQAVVLAVVSLGASGTLAGDAAAAVFGQDQRTSVPPRYAHLQKKIGLLYNDRAKTVCTAFCVAPGLIATAAHCLYRTTGDRPPALGDFIFTPSYDNQREASRIAGHAIGSASQNVLAGSMSIRVRPPIDAASDWALVRLSSPACKGGHLAVRPMGLEEIEQAASNKRLFQLSYHRDYPSWQLAYSRPCSASSQFGSLSWSTIARDFSSPQALVLHRCATGGASSGSPLLIETADGPVVVGINVGTYVLSKVLVKEGKIAKRFRQDVIANTAVNAQAFAGLLPQFRDQRPIDTAERMRELQERLKDLHHYTGAIDGTYGPLLRAAIQDFERTHGLAVTGMASESLLGLIAAGGGQPKPVGALGGGINKPSSHEGLAPVR
jgi:protease YdgD